MWAYVFVGFVSAAVLSLLFRLILAFLGLFFVVWNIDDCYKAVPMIGEFLREGGHRSWSPMASVVEGDYKSSPFDEPQLLELSSQFPVLAYIPDGGIGYVLYRAGNGIERSGQGLVRSFRGWVVLIGRQNAQLRLERLAAMAREWGRRKDSKGIPAKDGTDVYTVTFGSWKWHARYARRSVSSLVFPDNTAPHFLRALDGKHRRKSYLLVGPPGTGKTSLICAMASEMGVCICAFDPLKIIADAEAESRGNKGTGNGPYATVEYLISKVPEDALLTEDGQPIQTEYIQFIEIES